MNPTRGELRQQYQKAWQKYQKGESLTPLEDSIANIIEAHPEYHKIFNTDLAKDFHPELGETNPFLHMGLHLGLREQISTNRPAGIAEIYHTLCQKQSVHDTEHQMMDILAEMLWQAERSGQMPDESAYLAALKELLKSGQ